MVFPTSVYLALLQLDHLNPFLPVVIGLVNGSYLASSLARVMVAIEKESMSLCCRIDSTIMNAKMS